MFCIDVQIAQVPKYDFMHIEDGGEVRPIFMEDSYLDSWII